MKIRRAKLSDYEELMKLYDIFYELSGDKVRYSKHNSDSFKEILKDDNSYIYIAEDNKKLVGFASFSFRYVVRYPKKIAQLEELFVLDKYRKQGIGKSFIKELESKALDVNCTNIYIESGFKHEVAHKFYQDLGYKKDGYYFKKILT